MFTSREPDEIVTGVTVPKLPDGRLPLIVTSIQDAAKRLRAGNGGGPARQE